MTIAAEAPGTETFPTRVPNAPGEPPHPHEPPPPHGSAPLDPSPCPRDLRNAGVAFALSNISVEAGRTLLKSMHENHRKRVEAQLTAEIERTRGAEQCAVEELLRARTDHITAVENLRAKNALEERRSALGDAIRIKRHEFEAKKLTDELDRLDSERTESIERLGRERTMRHEANVAAWKERANERNAQAEQLTSLREQLAEGEKEIRTAAAERMNRWMTRTACGFLIWAGYTVIGTTGIAVSALLNDVKGRSLLIDVGTSAVKLMSDFQRGSLHPMIAAPLSMLAFLSTVVLLLVLIDALMRWFEKRWLERREQPRRFVFPSKEEISRSTFSKLLVAVPFIYISGVVIAFIAYGGQVSADPLLLGKTNGVFNAMIGSALSLLSASIFLLYFANILEPRASSQGWRWRTRWEVGMVPFVMLLAIVLIAIFGPQSRWAWAGVTAFMLLGAMALAYGLLYRGMFRELDYAARGVIDCDRRIEEILKPPEKEDPDRAEQREIEGVLSDYRARRQHILDLDRARRIRRTFLTSDENDPTLVAAYQAAASFLWKVWVRFRRIGPQPDFYRVTDYEAAPIETEQRQSCEQQIRRIELELQILNPEATRIRRETHEQDFEKAQRERKRAERAQPLTLAATDERESQECFDFEGAFAVGLSTKPSYDLIARRRDETIGKAERPRVKRPPVPSHAEEVQSDH